MGGIIRGVVIEGVIFFISLFFLCNFFFLVRFGELILFGEGREMRVSRVRKRTIKEKEKKRKQVRKQRGFFFLV